MISMFNFTQQVQSSWELLLILHFIKKCCIEVVLILQIRVFSKIFTVITVISQINAGTTENSW